MKHENTMILKHKLITINTTKTRSRLPPRGAADRGQDKTKQEEIHGI